MKLLIIDDSRLILKQAEQILASNDVPSEISVARSGPEALEIMEKEPIDIILLDIIMPKVSGIDILKKIKQDPHLKNTKVLMFSSLVDTQTLQECFEAGATDYITKPLEEIEFLARVKSAIREKTLENENLRHTQKFIKQNQALESLNKKLQTTQLKLVQQEKLAGVGQLAAGVAHEINNPLGFIMSNFSTLHDYFDKYQHLLTLYENWQKTFPDSPSTDQLTSLLAYRQKNDFAFISEDVGELFNDTSEGFERVRKIVNGLRTFSRIDQIEDFEDYNLNEGIENTLVISRNAIKYSATIEKSLGEIPNIEAVGGQINQVILNILLNAGAAVKSRWQNDMGKIIIRTSCDDNNVFLSIKDNGVGISKKNQQSIFDPFFTTKPIGEGTGLGLSISYDIVVNKHKGSIDVKSTIGEGTEFILCFPIRHTNNA